MNDYRKRTNGRRFKYFPQLMILLGLVGLFLLVQWIVQTFQKPGHMGVIESQTMDMSIEPPAGAMPVSIETIEPTMFASAITYTGSAVAYNEIMVFPRVEGWLTSLPVYPGDRVQAGQLLAKIDTKELSSKTSEAQANQAATYFQKEKAHQAISNAQAALAFRQEQIRRSRALVAEDVITREEAQKDESDFTAAQSQYQQAKSEWKAAQQSANAASSQAKTQRIIQGYSRITSPQKGVITQRLVSPGTLVSPGMAIMQISQIQPLRIQTNVAESDAQQVKIGAPITIYVQKTGKPIQSKVSAIFPKADLQTRTSIVEAVIPNADELLIPGDFVTVSIHTGKQENILTVSNTAIITMNEQQAVWTMINDKAHLQFVTTGGTNGNRTAIIDGLKAGDTVIVQGNQNLSEGVAVATADYGPQGLRALPKTVSSSRLSPSNQYQIKHSLGMYLATIWLVNKIPKLGQNTLVIEVVSGSGMTMPINNISLEMTSLMPSMSTMQVPKPSIKKTGDGKFNADVMLGMPGLWKLTLTVKDGSQILGTFPVEVEVPES